MALVTKFIKPDISISDFVESFWMLSNPDNKEKEAVILPDGRVDLFLSRSASDPFHITLMGLEIQPSQTVIVPQLLIFAISFKPLATEYILQSPVSDLVDKGKNLPVNFWDFSENDLNDFDSFCQKATGAIRQRIAKKTDDRKRKLFDLIYTTNGAMSVSELSEKVSWTSRQINRYFNQQYGISLKVYCNILRFRASFQQIKEGKLFPEQNFVDQSHFIKEIKKLSGVAPKELSLNKNDRFIQLSTLPEK